MKCKLKTSKKIHVWDKNPTINSPDFSDLSCIGQRCGQIRNLLDPIDSGNSLTVLDTKQGIPMNIRIIFSDSDRFTPPWLDQNRCAECLMNCVDHAQVNKLYAAFDNPKRSHWKLSHYGSEAFTNKILFQNLWGLLKK